MHIFHYQKEFTTETCYTFPSLEIAYHTIGNLNAERNNVVWVCHALTANSDVADWWDGLVGEASALNPAEYFIVCANVLGGCYGTTGPLSINGFTGKKYYHDFPLITIPDMVAVHDLLREELGIERIKIGIGGSMGGQQILEWSLDKPSLFESIVVIAANAAHSPYGIAFNEAQRMSIEADSSWLLNIDEAGLKGMEAARAIALLSYRNYAAYQQTQSEDIAEVLDEFKASKYQQYQGLKLRLRFNAFSYYTLSKAMDTHNLSRNRKSMEKALGSILSYALIVSIDSDQLFPPSEQLRLQEGISNSTYASIESAFGHDGFLVEQEKIANCLAEFIEKCNILKVAHPLSN